MNSATKPALTDFGTREAGPDDSYEMWLWWNDPVTRQMMKVNDYVPWESHHTWFNATLRNPARMLVMVVCRFGKVGVVRHDDKGRGIYETSIHFNPMFRGQGLGGYALTHAREYLIARKTIRAQFATLKQINVASKKSFERSRYVFGAPPPAMPGLERFTPDTELFCLWTPQQLANTAEFVP
jgi:ribosomal protein S18 acetylase RimI-like enzyme